MFQKIRTLFVKEFQILWNNKRIRFVICIPPLIQFLVFSFALTLEVKNIDISIYNQDSGKHSIELIQRLLASPSIRNAHFVYNQNDLATKIREQETMLAIRFPPNFSKRIQEKESGAIQFIYDGRRSNAVSIAQGYISSIVENYSREIVVDLRLPITNSTLIQRNWYNPNLESIFYTAPSLVVILLTMFILVITSLSVAREREIGTFEQLTVSPLTPNEILLGKTSLAFIVALTAGSSIIFLSIYIFGITFQGSFLLLYSSMIIFLLATIGVGLFISAVCMTQQQAILGAYLFSAPAIMISGFATPVENMPVALQTVAEFMPMKHFLIVMKGVFIKDMDAATVLRHTWPNILIASVTLPLASWFFKKRI